MIMQLLLQFYQLLFKYFNYRHDMLTKNALITIAFILALILLAINIAFIHMKSILRGIYMIIDDNVINESFIYGRN